MELFLPVWRKKFQAGSFSSRLEEKVPEGGKLPVDFPPSFPPSSGGWGEGETGISPWFLIGFLSFFRLDLVVMASPNSEPCLVCVSSKKSWDHLCLRHALCLDNNGLWDPSRCADCLSHFDSRLSVDDCGEYGRRSLIQVAKKIKKALKRADL